MSPSEDLVRGESGRISALRMQLLDCHPFWGHLLLQTQLIPAPELEALAATDCFRRIWFNPNLTTELSMPQLGFVLAHEVGHMVFASAARLRGRNPVIWNCATDYAINRIVGRIENPTGRGEFLYQAPKGILLDYRYNGWIAEAIYEDLMERQPPKTKKVRIKIDGLDYGSVVDHGGSLDVHLPFELDPEQERELQDRLSSAVKAWKASDQRGHIPGGLELLVSDRKKSVVPWRRLLHRYLSESLVADEYSLSRPNRRYLAEDIVVPGLIHGQRRELVVAVDTSASMGRDELVRAGSELATLAGVEPKITVIVADATIQRVVEPRDLPAFLQKIELRGGGGTSHVPVFDWIEKNKKRPDLFIGLTDLCSAFPKRPPPYPVLWVTPRAHGTAPWGRTIVMEEGGST